MAWKCDKCGMPNFDDGECKLCGAPKPENPEDFVEEITEPEAAVSAEPEMAVSAEPETAVDETEMIPEPEVVPEEEPESLPEEEPEAMPDAAIIYTESPVLEEEDTPKETENAIHTPVVPPIEPKTTDTADSKEPAEKKNRAGIIILGVIIAILLCAIGIYIFTSVQNSRPANSKVSVSPSPKAAVATPVPTPEPTPAPLADPTEETPDVSAPDVTVVTTDAPTAVPTQKVETKPTAKATATPVASVSTPKPTPVATPKPTPVSTPEPWNDGYKKFISKDYGFYCAYPADFAVSQENTNDALLTAISPDGTAIMMIQAAKNWDNLSTEEALTRYISMFNGEVQYRASGNTWYAASVKVGDRVYYRKAFVRSGVIYCFSFEYDDKDKNLYSPYIEYMEDHFKRL